MLPNFHFSIERWRKNEEYGVWVSTHGRVRLIKNKEFLNIRINQSGYCTVFTDKGQELVHRLVAYTWLGGKRNAKYSIDHINSNKRDNTLKNLRWIERELNQDYATYTSTQTTPDTIECIEKTEQEQKVIIAEAVSQFKSVGKAFAELFQQGKMILIADEQYELRKYEDILGFLRTGAMPAKKKFFTNVMQAVKNKTGYYGHTWEYKEV